MVNQEDVEMNVAYLPNLSWLPELYTCNQQGLLRKNSVSELEEKEKMAETDI